MPLSPTSSEESAALHGVGGAPPASSLTDNSSAAIPKVRLPIFHNGVFWAAAPALALFALSVLSARVALPKPVGLQAAKPVHSAIVGQNWVVPASQTVLVSRQAASNHAVLRGRLRLTESENIAAPTSGAIARVLVQPGQSVRAGQQLALLTTGVAPSVEQTAQQSPIEQWQKQAEAAQIAAAQQHEQLEKRISAANEELQRAQQRVTAAQNRVAEARRLIARLQSGEEVVAPRSTPAAPRAATPRVSTPEPAKDSAERTAALRESRKLIAEAEAAEEKARAAQKAAREAEAVVAEKQQKLQTALTAASENEKTQPASTPANGAATEKADGDSSAANSGQSSADDKETKAVAAARENALEAKAHATALRRTATRLKTTATSARTKANAAARRTTQHLQLFDGDATEKAQPVSSPSRAEASAGKTDVKKESDEKITIAEAARIARAAMQESEDAIKDAEKIRRKVEGYGRPVESTRKRFDLASKQLQEAQQRIWENAPAMRTTQTPLVASRDGIVTWVAPAARVVQPGEAVVGVGRPDRMEVVIADKSGVWKSLKPDARILALVQRQNIAPANGETDSPAASATQTSARVATVQPVKAAALKNDSDLKSFPTMARVLAVEPPAQPGGAARIRIAVHNPPEQNQSQQNSPAQAGENSSALSPRAFAPGMAVFFSLMQPTSKNAIRIPTVAVHRGENGRTFVAVLSPLENQEQDRPVDECRVEWREVLLAPGDGDSNPVKSGLKEGERVALRPDVMHSFTTTYGAQATVRVEQI